MGSDVNRREWNTEAVTEVYASRVAPPSEPTSTAPPASRAPNPITGLLPAALDGLRVLDVSCAVGVYSRSLARRGARVVGLDIAEGLIEIARREEREAPLGIEYVVHDLMAPLPPALGAFDVAVSIMTVMDVEDPLAAVRHICRAVRPSGLFAFSLPHPCFHVRVKEGKRGLEVDVESYFDRTRVRTRRIAAKDGSGKEAVYSQYHRTLGDYLNTLIDEGFCLERFLEPGDRTLHVAARRSARA